MRNGERIPPQALDVERTVLGSIMADRAAAEIAFGILSENCFYHGANRKIFLCMLSLFEKNEPIDVVSVSNNLKMKSWLDEVGSDGYLAEIVEAIATSGNIEYYAKILKNKAILRHLIAIAGEIHTECFDEETDPEKALECASNKIFEVANSHGIACPIFTATDMVRKTYDEMERVHRGGRIGVTTGYQSLDDVILGFCRPDLIIIAGRPSSGKTAAAMNIITRQTVVHKIPILIFTIEMSQIGLGQRALSIESGVGLYNIRKMDMGKEKQTLVAEAAGRIAEAPIYGCDASGITLNQIRTVSRRAIRQFGIEVIYIDHTRLMGSRQHNPIDRMTEISHGLKNLAKELDRPIVALHQISRPQKGKKVVPRPQLSDLRDSGAVEEDADIVLFVHRDFIYSKKEEDRHKAEIIIGKQRNGPLGEVVFNWNAEYTRFSELKTQQEEW
jgi:replicative DNA helicase